MKINLIKYSILCFLIIGLTQSCVKESFEGDNVGDAGTTFISSSEDFGFIQYIDAFADKRNVVGFTLFKNAHNKGELNKSSAFILKENRSAIDKYNEENETELEVLDPELYTIANSNIVKKDDQLTFSFPSDVQYQPFTINVDGSKLDLSKTYAFAYDIIDADGYTVPTGRETILVLLGVKNDWDGVYKYQTSENTSLEPNQDTEVELITVGQFKVQLKPGLLGAYSNDVFYTINPETNAVTVECPSLGVQEPQDARSIYDPETRTLTVFWKQGNGARTFEETFTYLRAR